MRGHRPDPLDPRLRVRSGSRLAHETLHDWMISKKRIGAWRSELTTLQAEGRLMSSAARRVRIAPSRPGTGRRPHAATALRGRGDDRVPVGGGTVDGSRGRRQPVADAGIVPFFDATSAGAPILAAVVPADFITERFPGQFRKLVHSMLAMSTVLRREPPFKTII